jgi:transcriptional regulator GlxA family with amidase domain
VIDFGGGRWQLLRLPLTRRPEMDRRMVETKRIAFLLFEGCDLLDVAGAVAVFDSTCRRAASAAGPAPLYRSAFLSLSGGTLRTEQGLAVETDKAGELAPGELDTIIVVGGSFETLYDASIADWIRRNHLHVRRIASVCLGTFLLAQSGLLEGMQATTHWDYCDRLSSDYPAVEVVEDAIYIPGAHVWTSAGVTSGIDMALAMVEEDYGRELALAVARYQVVFLKRPGGQSQFSAPLRVQTVEGPLAPILQWIAENPCEDLRTETLAERANMSLRNFFRAFEEATGTTPADWVELTRLDDAKRLLEQTRQAVDQVAFHSGFGSYERMRKTFARRLRITPGEYRERFSRETPGDVNLTASLLAARHSLEDATAY